jgi:hypothetical protein
MKIQPQRLIEDERTQLALRENLSLLDPPSTKLGRANLLRVTHMTRTPAPTRCHSIPSSQKELMKTLVLLLTSGLTHAQCEREEMDPAAASQISSCPPTIHFGNKTKLN